MKYVELNVYLAYAVQNALMITQSSGQCWKREKETNHNWHMTEWGYQLSRDINAVSIYSLVYHEAQDEEFCLKVQREASKALMISKLQ